VHRLEHTRIDAKIRGAHRAEAAHQTGAQIGHDVAVQVRQQQYVEFLRSHHQVHAGGVDDLRVVADVRIVRGHRLRAVDEEAVRHLHDVRFVNGGDPRALETPRVLEGEPRDAHGRALGDDLRDFGDTAALLENLDLLISVDTSVLHLAGAMAKPAWALLPASPDWRWLLGRSDSPWYPTMRLFRQPTAGDWTHVVQSVGDAIVRFAGESERV